MPPTIIFDLDGTLVRESPSLWEQTSAVAPLFGDSVADRQAVVTAFFACNDFVTTHLPERKHDIPFYLSYVGRSLGKPLTPESAATAATAWTAAHRKIIAEPELFPDTVATLSELSARGFRLVVASGGSQESREAILVQTGIRDFFSHVFASREVGYQKQEVQFWEEVLPRVGWTAGAPGIVVGNQVNDDIVHPLHFGLPAVLIEYPEPLKKVSRLPSVAPTATYASLSEMLAHPLFSQPI